MSAPGLDNPQPKVPATVDGAPIAPGKKHWAYKPDEKLRVKSFLNGISNQILLGISQNKRQDCMHSVDMIVKFIEENTDEC